MHYSESPLVTESNDSLLEVGVTMVIQCYLPAVQESQDVPLSDVCHVTLAGSELLMDFSRTLFLAGK